MFMNEIMFAVNSILSILMLFSHIYIYIYIYMCVCVCVCVCVPRVALRPNGSCGLLILDVSRSHTTTHHIW